MTNKLPRVVNHYKCESIEPDAVNIQRPSKWGNKNHLKRGVTRDDVIDAYERDVRANPALMSSLTELVGKQLVCSCKPQSCHGDVLVSLVQEMLIDKGEL